MKNLSLQILGVSMAYFIISCGTPSQSEPAATEENTEVNSVENEEASAATDVKSNLVWTGAKIIGDSHTGTIGLKDVQLDLEEGTLKGGSFTIDMNSIVNNDVEDAEWNQKLVGHLKSEDFFQTETYPTSTFVITNVEALDNGKFSVTGDLTVKATTKSETFEVMKSETDTECSFAASIEIDRTNYDVRYGSTNFFDDLGDKAIKNEITLDVNLTVAK